MAANPENHIPEVDISAFTTNGDLESRRRTAKELARCASIHGCCGITGHGIPSQLLKQAFEISEKMFGLPYDEKMKAPHPDALLPHRGFSGVGKEKASGKEVLETDDEEKKKAIGKVSDYKVG